MSSEEQVARSGEPEAGVPTTEPGEATATDAQPATQPDWWHRDHPVFTPLAGFFTGLLYVVIIPGTFAALLRLVLDEDAAEELFPLVLVALAVPIGLTIAPRTRRFGRFMLLGIVSTAVVVLGTAGLVLWVLYATDS